MKEIMGKPKEVAQKLDNTVDRILSTEDGDPATYKGLAVIWLAAGTFVAENAFERAIDGSVGGDPVEFAGYIATAAVCTAAGSAFWRQSWRSSSQ